MKKFGRAIALALGAVMTLSLAACAAHPEAKNAEDLVKISNEYQAKVKSYDMTAKASLIMKEDATTTKVGIDLKGSWFAEPMKMGMDMTVDADGKKEKVSMYIAPNDEEQTVVYMYAANKWIAQAVDTAEIDAAALTGSLGIDVQKLNDEFMKANMDSFKVVGEDVVYGLNATIIEGKISGESLKAIVDAAGVFTATGVAPTEAEDLLAAMFEKDVKVKAWVLDTNLMPVKYIIDMTDMFNNFVKKAASAEVAANKGSEAAQEKAAANVSVLEYKIEMSLKNINRATAVNVPAAALKAAENPTGPVTLADPTATPVAVADPSPSPVTTAVVETSPSADAAADASPSASADAEASPSPSASADAAA